MKRSDLPPTFGTGDPAQRVFDPALKQHPNAFRPHEPAFASDDDAVRWRRAHRAAMQHVLALVAASPWRDSLVLRGSAVMASLFGDRAREPKDIDWIVCPASLSIGHPNAVELQRRIVRLVAAKPAVGDLCFALDQVATDDLWTYSRVPGRRITIPWTIAGLPPGLVQMDLVFGETCIAPTQGLMIDLAGSGAASVVAASDAESLAWKLLWLLTDQHPQSKDLYDAVLLREQTPVDTALLYAVFAASPDVLPAQLARVRDGWRALVQEQSPPDDWSDFVSENAAIAEGLTPEALVSRLTRP